jgi:hypothetical protein
MTLLASIFFAKFFDAVPNKPRLATHQTTILSCEGANCVEYAPSRPLMRSLLSQFQTPTTPRRAVGFFGSGPHFAVAPVTDYSMLDTWLPLLCADCSALRIVCPVLAADFTRCPSLSSLRRWQIALLPPPGARAGSRVTPRHGLLRVQHLELRLAYELLRTRCLAFPVVLGLLLARRFPLPRRSRIAPCPTLDPPCRSTDCSVR